MVLNLCSILLASAALLGSAAAAPVEADDGMIHEYITRDDGTIDHFAYHSSFVPNSNIEVNLIAVGIAKNLSSALENRDVSGAAAAIDQFGLHMPANIKDKLLLVRNATTGHTIKPAERLDKPFIGSNTYQNASFCGFPFPIPDWNKIGFTNRPDTYDCTRLLEMWLHKPGYFQLSKFGGYSETDWSFLTLYNSCEMDVRRLDFENDWGARVGSFDIMTWVTAAMLVSLGVDYKNPEALKYMASITGTIGCEEMGPNPIALLEFELIRNQKSPQPTGSQATQTPTWAPLPSAMSSLLTQATPTAFPLGAAVTITVTPTSVEPGTTVTMTVIPTKV